jgi:hypothetical protein
MSYNTYIHGDVTRELLYSCLKLTKMSFFLLENQTTEGYNRSFLGDWCQ